MDTFARRPMCETAIDMPLPKGSYCVDMACGEGFLIALFNVPDRGVVPFLIYPDKNEVHEIVPACPTNDKG